MSDLGKGLLISIMVAGLMLGRSVMAEETELSQELQDMTRIVSMACPKRWEDIPEYLAHNIDHDAGRLYYPQEMADVKVDIWAGDAIDRMNYIKYARFFLIDEDGFALDTYTHPASVAYQCYVRRNALMIQLYDEDYQYSGSFNRFGEFRDDDDDLVMNAFDECANTVPVAEDDTVFPYLDANNNGIHDPYEDLDGDGFPDDPLNQPGCALSQLDQDDDGVSNYLDQCLNTPAGEIADGINEWVGCSATERDSDYDGVNDAYDDCPDSTDPESANAQGCDKFQIDSDGDGIPDFMDVFPHQGGTQCTP